MKLLTQVLVAATLALICTASFVHPSFGLPAQSRVPFTSYGMSRFSQRYASTTAPVARTAFGPMPARMVTPPKAGMTPELTWYVPTGQCPGGWYCRAQLTMYSRFDGKTEVRAGYSVWFFEAPSAPIPSYTRTIIAATSMSEIRGWTNALVPVVEDGFQGKKCKLDVDAIDKAMDDALWKFSHECTEQERSDSGEKAQG